MLPLRFDLLGVRWDVWDLALLIGLIGGYGILRLAWSLPRAAPPPAPRWLGLRYLLTGYLAVLAAQLFAYAFDAGTTLAPPRSMSWVYYYFSPTAGPKTLYGAALAVPIVVFAVATLPGDLRFDDALDRWTPALFAVLATARVGCLLQGCCYGVTSQAFGVPFPPGAVVHSAHMARGWVSEGDWSLPVVPTQALSALALVVLCGWSLWRLSGGSKAIFFDTLVVYSGFRFVMEFFRDDPARNQLGPLSTSQWIAIAVIASYAAVRLRTRRVGWANPPVRGGLGVGSAAGRAAPRNETC